MIIYLSIHALFAEDYKLSIYFKFDDRETYEFSDNEKYIQFKASANCEDSEADFGNVLFGSYVFV